MPQLIFLPHAERCPEGAVIEAEPGDNLIEVALDNGDGELACQGLDGRLQQRGESNTTDHFGEASVAAVQGHVRPRIQRLGVRQSGESDELSTEVRD